MTTNSNKLIEIFYSYASTEDGRDEELQQQLERHLGILKRQGKIATWHKRNILAGQVASEEIIRHLNSAQIILLLISPDFVASDQCWDIEMDRALERQQEEKVLVIPVILRPLDYQEAPFNKLRVLPKNGKPVTSWSNQDEAFEDIARNVRLLAEKFEKTQKISWKDLGVGISLAAAISTLITSSTSNVRVEQANTIGVMWHIQPLFVSQNLYGIAWSGSQFIAVGSSGTIIASPDGHTWYRQDFHNWRDLFGIAKSGLLFAAVGDDGIIVGSRNGGNTWNVLGFGGGRTLSGVAGSDSQFIAVGNNNTIYDLQHFIDASITPIGLRFLLRRDLYGVIKSGSHWVVVGSRGTILTSPDGHTWSFQDPPTSQELRSVVWSGSQFVAVGSSGTILTSPDGHTWHRQNSPTSQELRSVAWSGSQFIAVGSSGTILTSLDGHTWHRQNSPTSQELWSVAWSGSRFVAVGSRGSILTSP